MSMGNKEPTMTEEPDDQSSLNSDNSCGLNRVKFLYSHGGRILPRPKDGKLRYVGGQTRVIAVNRNIAFSGLVAKMKEILGLTVVLKCQLPAEDLDALVSIRSDEDFENILEEYDRFGAKERSYKIRAFLFPKPTTSPVNHADLKSERALLQSHDEGANGYVASSTPSEASRPPHTPEKAHGMDMYSFPALDPLCTPFQHPLQNIPSKPDPPPRYPPVHPAVQYNSPVRNPILSATHVHPRATMPHQQKSGARAFPMAYVEHSSCARKVYCDYHSASPNVPLSGMSRKVPEDSYNSYLSHNLYRQRGLESFCAQQQLLVQH